MQSGERDETHPVEIAHGEGVGASVNVWLALVAFFLGE